MNEHNGKVISRLFSEAHIELQTGTQVYYREDSYCNWGTVVRQTKSRLYVNWYNESIALCSRKKQANLKILLVASIDVHFDGGTEWVYSQLQNGYWQMVIENGLVNTQGKGVKYVQVPGHSDRYQDALVTGIYISSIPS